MRIQFSRQELADMRSYFDKMKLAENPLLAEQGVEWNRLFLLLRKLLAYGVQHTVQTNPAIPYSTLQKISQKSDSMRETLRVHFSDFDQLLTDCLAQHQR